MIKRLLNNNIEKRIQGNKVIIIHGARQVGKTTLINAVKDNLKDFTLFWNGDEPDIRNALMDASSSALKEMAGKAKYIFIDEAQRIENIGLTLKLLIDNYPEIQLIATGSSAFDLANKISEPLTGRKWEFQLFPISTGELIDHHGALIEKRLLKRRLVYGFYPEIINNPGDEVALLKTLADSYLYKDILIWENVKKPDKLEKLLQAIAFQLGSQVSYNELSRMVGLDFHTVEKYIQLLEKTFVIFRLHSFSRNLRNELKKSRKIYFYDNGIRNAIINKFNPIDLRADSGALWENFLVSERLKKLHYAQQYTNRYFWRTHAQQEIDYIEESNGEIRAYEFKYRAGKNVRFSKSFLNAYDPVETEAITPENYLEFVK